MADPDERDDAFAIARKIVEFAASFPDDAPEVFEDNRLTKHELLRFVADWAG